VSPWTPLGEVADEGHDSATRLCEDTAMGTHDRSKIETYLKATDEALRAFIDPAHMSYLPVYLGRADARFALGESAEAVLRELWLASKVYAVHGPVFLAKWPHAQVRRRRLEPLEVGLAAGDPDVLKALAKIYGCDPISLFAGLEPDDIAAEVKALTGYFGSDTCSDPMELAGTLAVFYWLMLACAAGQDGEGFEASRRRATRCLDDFGHLAGGASGGIARIRTLHQALQQLRPPRPEAFVDHLLNHVGLWRLEHERAIQKGDEAAERGGGALDRTALALMALARAFDVDLGDALVSKKAEPWLLAFAGLLGHSVPSAPAVPTTPNGSEP
jgi:hypothetical protein